MHGTVLMQSSLWYVISLCSLQTLQADGKLVDRTSTRHSITSSSPREVTSRCIASTQFY